MLHHGLLLWGLALLLAGAPAAGAQVTETPQAFDSNGRVLVITPSIAARLQLGPPEWRVFGDYAEARLYQRSDGGYVLIATRRGGNLERYELSLGDVNAIRDKVNTLPAGFAFTSSGNAGSAFVRNQTLLGFFVYGPSLAAAVANEGTGQASTYLLVAGGTFFVATQVARNTGITQSMNSLGTHMAIRGAAMGAGLTGAIGMSSDGIAAGVFAGALGGTVTGLALGRGWSDQEIEASKAAADVFLVSGFGLAHIARGGGVDNEFLTRGEGGVLAGVGVAGYLLGNTYGRLASHNFSNGDGRTLWVTGALGTAAGSITFAGRNVSDRSKALALTGGYLAGVIGGELLLARRFDLSLHDASLMGFGTAAGGLIGLGIARMLDDEGDTDTRTMTFATVGGLGGLFLSHYLLAPPLDAGNPLRVGGGGGGAGGSALQFNPAGLALAAARVPGKFPILSLNLR